MENIRHAAWEGWDKESKESLELQEDPDGILVNSTIVYTSPKSFAADYTIQCDTQWRVRSIVLGLAGSDRQIAYTSDGQGNWKENGTSIEKFAGAIDVDITATPFTNTLPIRRLNLQKGESAEINVVYIVVPELSVTVDHQKYTCITPFSLYRFESGDFARDITVDTDGLVLEYPDLFKRTIPILPSD